MPFFIQSDIMFEAEGTMVGDGEAHTALRTTVPTLEAGRLAVRKWCVQQMSFYSDTAATETETTQGLIESLLTRICLPWGASVHVLSDVNGVWFRMAAPEQDCDGAIVSERHDPELGIYQLCVRSDWEGGTDFWGQCFPALDEA